MQTRPVLGGPELEGGLRGDGDGPAVHGGKRVISVLGPAEYPPRFSTGKLPVLSAYGKLRCKRSWSHLGV